jgi:hypothetical protein
MSVDAARETVEPAVVAPVDGNRQGKGAGAGRLLVAAGRAIMGEDQPNVVAPDLEGFGQGADHVAQTAGFTKGDRFAGREEDFHPAVDVPFGASRR